MISYENNDIWIFSLHIIAKVYKNIFFLITIKHNLCILLWVTCIFIS